MTNASLFPAETHLSQDTSAPKPYRVLARTYRPYTFRDLIGQEPMIRTLSNAIEKDRIAHAFILTGVRGVGKTTTARIIARALNCLGPDGTSGPTIDPCGVCESCQAITQDRHIDVLEIDAASHTGVDDMRDLIDGVQYRPVQARYRIYIIDEVHMLSKSAFNALLKTLEEPPSHAKFLFATTEIRRVPVTILSRCQRFDLRRIPAHTLTSYLEQICEKEKVDFGPGALSLIVRAAEGSVRDSLSLLDQAIAFGNGHITADVIRSMLGLADRGRTADLFEKIMSGQVSDALQDLNTQYQSGTEPDTIITNLLEYSHILTRLRVAPDAAMQASDDVDMDRARDMATRLDMAQLNRAWQVLLKGLEDVRLAPSALEAADMVLIRLAYASSLPSPLELIQKAQAIPPGQDQPPPSVPPSATGPATVPSESQETAPSQPDCQPQSHIQPATFEDMVRLLEDNKEAQLVFDLKTYVHLVSLDGAQSDMVIRLGNGAPTRLISILKEKLLHYTGQCWRIQTSTAQGSETLKQQQNTHRAHLLSVAMQDPVIMQVLHLFPRARIDSVTDMMAGAVLRDIPPEIAG